MMRTANCDTTSTGELKFSVVIFLIQFLMLLNSAASVYALLNIYFRESQLEVFCDSNISYLQSKAPLEEAFQNVMQN